MTSLRDRDPFDVRLALNAPEPLRAFNDAGVLSAADVQVARRLATLGGVDDPPVLLAIALAVRAPRLGHVLMDLATIRTTVAVDTEEPVDLGALPWPEPAAWTAAVAACGLVAVGEDADGDAVRPLRLVGTALYLDRYWREERAVARALRARAASAAPAVDAAVLADGLRRLYRAPTDDDDDRGRAAAEAAVRRRLTVIAGGPGTGKTSTVGRIVALLVEQAAAAGAPAPLVALAAPTGKAAVRLAAAVTRQAEELDVTDAARAALAALSGTTLHRLLGDRPGTRSRFRHDALNRLPHDVVVVDKSSMVSLTMMARLCEAVRPEARLVLVGDPDQLTSIEAGAVLGDVVGAAGEGADGVVVLRRQYRYGVEIAKVADAIRRGDADATVRLLASGSDDVHWFSGDAAELQAAGGLRDVRDAAVAAGRAVIAAAGAGDGRAALTELAAFRLLCAHRRGPYGVSAWSAAVEGWLADDIDAAGGRLRDYAGRPLLVMANDRHLDLYNGDSGVMIAGHDDRLWAAFERRGEVATVRPNQLGAVDTVYAMTVHKSQGSQFGTAAVILPPPTSRILTRELLYTGVTRARDRLVVVGTEEAIRAAVARPAARASGLRARLWTGRDDDAGA